MIAEFTLYGTQVSGKNALRVDPRTHHHYAQPRFERWRSAMSMQINRQFGALPIFRQPVKITVRYTPGDRYRRDSTGILDALYHLLEHVRMLKDDSLVKQVDYVELGLDRKNPRCQVKLETLEETPHE